MRNEAHAVTVLSGREAGAIAPAAVRIDRHLGIRRIGVGGVSVVYAAYDPELDRRVAIKLVRDDEQPDAAMRRERLLREARAMAKLDHANVIRGFDAGTATKDTQHPKHPRMPDLDDDRVKPITRTGKAISCRL